MNEVRRIQVHRFHETVAVVMLGGEEKSPTAYLSAALARQLGEELLRYAADVREVPRFSESEVGTVVLRGETEGNAGDGERHYAAGSRVLAWPRRGTAALVSWIPDEGEVVELLEEARSGGWDVYDVRRASGEVVSLHGFCIARPVTVPNESPAAGPSADAARGAIGGAE